MPYSYFSHSALLFGSIKNVRKQKQLVRIKPLKSKRLRLLLVRTLPSIGFPTPEKMLILKTLLKIRSAEIGSIYALLRSYQKQREVSEWIEIFIKEYAIKDSYRNDNALTMRGRDTVREDKETEERALAIFKKRHYGSYFGPEIFTAPKTADLKLALSFWSFRPAKMIRHLIEVKAFGLFETTIQELIKEYDTLEVITDRGTFSAIFKENTSEPQIQISFAKLRDLWVDICSAKNVTNAG